jgi:hypothetical protein
MIGHLSMWVTNDPERDWPIVAEHFRAFWAPQEAVPSNVALLDAEAARTKGIGVATGKNGHFLYGTPFEAAEAVATFIAGTPIDRINTQPGFVGMPQEMVNRHMEVLVTEFAPKLRELTSNDKTISKVV